MDALNLFDFICFVKIDNFIINLKFEYGKFTTLNKSFITENRLSQNHTINSTVAMQHVHKTLLHAPYIIIKPSENLSKTSDRLHDRGIPNRNLTKCKVAKSQGKCAILWEEPLKVLNIPIHGGSNTSIGQDYRQEGERLRKILSLSLITP